MRRVREAGENAEAARGWNDEADAFAAKLAAEKAAECTCEPEEFEGELIHWSTCPANEGGCSNGACEL